MADVDEDYKILICSCLFNLSMPTRVPEYCMEIVPVGHHFRYSLDNMKIEK